LADRRLQLPHLGQDRRLAVIKAHLREELKEAKRTKRFHTTAIQVCLGKDEGPGIPEDILARVSEPFFRVNLARQKPIPGAGLGLVIAKEIIERHHGTLDIVNRMGGAKQTVAFPRNLESVPL
jgi:signal transduction histidine kinase